MKIPAFLTCLILGFVALPSRAAQTEFVVDSYFPAELEFKELGPVQSDHTLRTPVAVSQVRDGSYFVEAGLKEYARRVYALAESGTLSIEVVQLNDDRAAYSLATLLRTTDLKAGPPGQWQSTGADHISFSQGNFWVRIQSREGDLNRRVAVSVSNRIGSRDTAVPSIVRHLPKDGYDSASMKYFLGARAFGAYSETPDKKSLPFFTGSEVVQARYAVQNQTGILTLVNFPTGQAAEEYFDAMGTSLSSQSPKGGRTYVKRAGPIVGILIGNFEPAAADKILSGIQFSYAIKWIFDKNNRGPDVIWGVPVGILGTVVRSIVFVGLLCGVSLLAGVAFATFRILLRGYAPHNFLDRPERTEMIRLKINEN